MARPKRIISFNPVDVTSTDVTPADLLPNGLNVQEVNDTLTLIKEVIQYDSSYVILDRTKVEAALLDPTTEAINYFTIPEIEKLLDQANYLGFISSTDIELIIARNDYAVFNTYITPDNYKLLLGYQLAYDPVVKRYTPEISELRAKGLDSYGINLIKDNLITILQDPNNIGLIHNEVDSYLDNKYRSANFISNTQIDYIYKFPYEFLRILNDDELSGLLDRTKSYLDFLTPAKVTQLKLLPNSTSTEILFNTLSANEIKQIVDKEVDLKFSVINALGYNELMVLFNSIRDSFVRDDLKNLVILSIEESSNLTFAQAQSMIQNALVFAEANTDRNILTV